jgi:hypothetical protein
VAVPRNSTAPSSLRFRIHLCETPAPALHSPQRPFFVAIDGLSCSSYRPSSRNSQLMQGCGVNQANPECQAQSRTICGSEQHLGLELRKLPTFHLSFSSDPDEHTLPQAMSRDVPGTSKGPQTLRVIQQQNCGLSKSQAVNLGCTLR